ncbi:NADH:ubiquinone oxidoreductase [Roseicyclus persicicus]|uniref:NADH:ubiquinone oxidoreductase n=1 Tax=Roseicyclus persicicus TaxID=2650661 RepID=A0A7X6JX28_9RHOB|nr:NADH:ubiquinone oxidoreductase [Roseibacterium persicicum]NKX44340.1 NADH:ubiquinone oxidoreductase [Roseibacterium persicicum]
MTIAEDLWLRGQAAQRNLLHIASYNSAFAGTAALQGLHMGLTAPQAFWAAIARAAAKPSPRARARAAAEVVPLVAEPAPVAVAPAPAPEPVAADPAPATVIPLVPAAEPVAATPSPLLLDEPRDGKPDDLTVLAGVGRKLATALNEFGIYHFDQIAALDEEGIAWLDAQQKGFRMICARYDLVGQAKALS